MATQLFVSMLSVLRKFSRVFTRAHLTKGILRDRSDLYGNHYTKTVSIKVVSDSMLLYPIVNSES